MQASDLPSFRIDDMRWQADAACRSADPALFFPNTRPGDTTHIPATVRAMCGRCDVRDDCLAHAIANNEQGIWAATTDNDRHRMTENKKKQRHRDRIRASDHGTTAAYRQHINDHTTPCPPCQQAHDQAQRKRQRRALA